MFCKWTVIIWFDIILFVLNRDWHKKSMQAIERSEEHEEDNKHDTHNRPTNRSELRWVSFTALAHTAPSNRGSRLFLFVDVTIFMSDDCWRFVISPLVCFFRGVLLLLAPCECLDFDETNWNGIKMMNGWWKMKKRKKKKIGNAKCVCVQLRVCEFFHSAW